MSYEYKEALGIRTIDSCRYVPVDIENETLASLTRDYKKLYVKLTHPQTQEDVVLDVLDLINGVSDTYQTFAAFLTTNGNSTLHGLNLNLETVEKHVVFQDVWSSIINDVSPIKLGVHPDNNTDPSTFKDLLLRFSENDYVGYDYFGDNCIFTVNGLVHRSNQSQHGIYLQDARTSCNLYNNTDLGMIDFNQLGGVTSIDIDDTLMVTDTLNKPWYNTKLNLGVDLTDKTLLLSIGGYLHLLDDVYDVINPKVGLVGINFNKYQLLQKYFDSKEIIDLDGLPVDYLTEDRSCIVKASVDESTEYIKALLNLSQTFAIVVNSNLYIRNTKLQNQDLEGKFITDRRPLGILKAQRGLVKEYHTLEDNGKYVTYVDNLKQANYAFETTDYSETINITNNSDPGNPHTVSDVYEVTLAKSTLI